MNFLMFTLCCFVLFGVRLVQSNGSVNEEELLQQLQVPETTVAAGTALIGATQSAQARHDLTPRLVPLIGKSINSQVFTTEMSVIGTLRLYDTVPTLMNVLQRGGGMLPVITASGLSTLRDDPLGKALSQLGEPAIAALRPLLSAPDRALRLRVINVLAAMPEVSARRALLNAQSEEKDMGVLLLLKARLGSRGGS